MGRKSSRNHKRKSQRPILQRVIALTMAVIMAAALIGVPAQAGNITPVQEITVSAEDDADVSAEPDELIVTSDAGNAAVGSDTGAGSSEYAPDSSEATEENSKTAEEADGSADSGSDVSDASEVSSEETIGNADGNAAGTAEIVSVNAALEGEKKASELQTATGQETLLDDDGSGQSDDTAGSTNVTDAAASENQIQPINEVTLNKDASMENGGKTATLNQAAEVSAETDAETGKEIDLTPYLTDESTIKISVNGAYYTLEELELKGLKVPEESPVKVGLYFNEIYDLNLADILYYQIPQNMFSNVSEMMGTVYEENAEGIMEKVGKFTIKSSGRIEVKLDETYFNNYKQAETGKLNLSDLYIGFSGNLSADHGKDSDSGDDEISLRGDIDGSGIKFKIPFDYKNENADVKVDKSSSFDPSTRVIHYTVNVTTPDTNTMTADNVKVTDTFQIGQEYITLTDGNYYFNAKTYLDGAEKEYGVDLSTGVWTIGEMKPGQTATLTYDVQMSKSFFTQNDSALTIDNQAELTFNHSGIDYALDSQKAPGTVLLTKAARNKGLLQTDEKGSYLTYTVVVTAYGSKMDDIKVEDVFKENAQAIDYFVVETGEPKQGTVEYGKDDDGYEKMIWYVGSLEANQSATINYRAYLKANAFIDGKRLEGDPPTYSLNLMNDASVYVKDPVSKEYEFYDEGTVSSTVKKLMLSKTGTTQDSADGIKFTIKVNGDPVANNVNYVEDKITGTTYLEDKGLTIEVYNSSSEMKLLGTYTASLTDILSSDKSSWKLNLSSVKCTDGKTYGLAGSYYYVMTYYGKTVNTSVSNSAGIGVTGGDGTIKDITQSIAISGVDFKYSKKVVDYDYSQDDGYVKWQTTITSDIVANSGYKDYVRYAQNGTLQDDSTNRYLWFTKDQIDAMELYQGSEQLVMDEDYKIIEYEKMGGNLLDENGDPEYKGFTIQFLKDFSGLATNPLTITYKTCISQNRMELYKDSTVLKLYNYGKYTFDVTAENPSYLEPVYANVGYKPNKGGIVKERGNYGTFTGYDSKTGYLYWYLRCNIQSNISTMPTENDPDYTTIVEEIPAGQTFVSIEVVDKAKVGTPGSPIQKGDIDYNYATYSYYFGLVTREYGHDVQIVGDPLVEENVDGQGTTRVTINLTGLHGWEYFKKYNKMGSALYDGEWNNWGRFTVRVITKISDEKFLSGDTYKNGLTVTNKATLYADELNGGSYTASASNKIYPSNDLLSKVANEYGGGVYTKYTLDVNKNGVDLITGEDEVTIVDVMETEGMNLAIDRDDFLKIYDVSADADDESKWVDITDKYLLTLEDDTHKDVYEEGEYATFKITIPDNTPIKIVYWISFQAEYDSTEKIQLSNSAYFEYAGKTVSPSTGKTNNSFQVLDASGTGTTQPYFYVYKTDQNLNRVEGARFVLYTVKTTGSDADGSLKAVLDDDGKPVLDQKVREATTGFDGKALFSGLDKGKIYCYMEISAPAGYTFDPEERHYIQFKIRKETGIPGLISYLPGTTRPVENTLTDVSYALPVSKTINGKDISTQAEFSFTLQLISSESGGSVYTDQTYKTEIPAGGIKTSIRGSGTTKFDKLYFTKTGTYKFLVTEDALSQSAKNMGFTQKDASVFTVTVTVGANKADNSLCITDITMSPGAEEKTNGSTVKNHSGAVTEANCPNFDNVAVLPEITVNLLAIKTFNVKRGIAIGDKEFKFALIQNNKIIQETYAQSNGYILFSLDFGTEDVGKTYEYSIQEIPPDESGDGTWNPVSYDAKPIGVTVEIYEDDDGELDYDVTYEVQDDDLLDGNDRPLMVNRYEAYGSYTLKGKKLLEYETTDADTGAVSLTKSGNLTAGTALNGSSVLGGTYLDVEEGEFSFTVLENGKPIASGTTKDGGEIIFEQINYVAADIGKHTYTIREDKGNVSYQNYDAEDVTVTLEVYDIDGSGTLGVKNVKFSGGSYDSSKEIMYFINTCKFEEAYFLPDTGGAGTWWYTFSGTLLTALVPVIWTVRRRRKRRKETGEK